jgi:hypothetical protein
MMMTTVIAKTKRNEIGSDCYDGAHDECVFDADMCYCPCHDDEED